MLMLDCAATGVGYDFVEHIRISTEPENDGRRPTMPCTRTGISLRSIPAGDGRR